MNILKFLLFIIIVFGLGILSFFIYIAYTYLSIMFMKTKAEPSSEEINDSQPIESDNSKSNTSVAPISPEMLDYNNVINRYLSTKHVTTPAEYGHKEYFIAEFNCILNHLKKAPIEPSDEKIYRQNAIEFPYEKSKNITSKTKIDSLKNFIAIDTETTGIKTGGNDIIEISAIKFIDFEPQEIFTTLLKPRKSIPKEATNINGITDEMVAESPKFFQIHNSLVGFLEGFPLVMHNASFDLKFLFVSGLDIDYEHVKVFDTLELSRRCIKDYDNTPLENYKLTTVCDEVSIYYDNAHRSSADALATGLLFNEIVKIKRNIPNLTEFRCY